MKIKEYILILDSNENSFQERVNKHLYHNWFLYEKPTIIKNEDGGFHYAQAMTRNGIDVYKEGQNNKKSDYELKPQVKERKLVDLFNNDFFNPKIAKQTEDYFLSKGWETLCIDGSILKMVKYED